MTEILSDAEYRLLNDNEKAKYWCNRYYDLQERYETALGRISDLSSFMWTIRQAAEEAKRLT